MNKSMEDEIVHHYSIALYEFGICFLFTLSLWYMRSFLYGLKRYRLNLNACKKRHKSETFWERLTYKKFRDVIPVPFLVWYWAIWIVHLTCMVLIFVIWARGKAEVYVRNILKAMLYYFDPCWIAIMQILFWSPKNPGWNYQNWLSPKVNKKKR